MDLRVGGFDWDDGNRSKCQQHGVSIAEIETLFRHGPRVAPDPKRAKEGRLVIRPVTARYMHAREIAAYEKAGFE